MVMEWWSGWFDFWGYHHQGTTADSFEENLRAILSQNASVNFYMFHGGTNFGYMNGANFNTNDQTNDLEYQPGKIKSLQNIIFFSKNSSNKLISKFLFSCNELRLWLSTFRRRKNHQKVRHNSNRGSRNSWFFCSWRATGWSGNCRLRNYSRFGSWPVVAKFSAGWNFRYRQMYRDGVVPDERRTRTAVRICALPLAGGYLRIY